MSRPLTIFYILVAYVLLQFSWWAYALVDLNKEIFSNRIELLEKSNLSLNEKTNYHQVYENKLERKKMMVLGEGCIFFAFLLIGIITTRKAFEKEFALARQQKNFLLSITHEFKSPLAAVKLNLQTLQKRNLDGEQKENVIRKALIETDRIHLLVENALMASRLESYNYEAHFENIDFSRFCKEVVSEFTERHDQEHEIKNNIENDIYYRGDTLVLTSLINNLLENAVKYSAENTSILFELKSVNNEIILKVTDNGNGIPDKEKKKIFTKFYRIGNEDTRKTKGTGLGLFIVSHVAAIHKAQIYVTDNLPKGASFEIKFPFKVS